MTDLKLTPTGKPIVGHFKLPPDKSLSHRALIMAAISQGDCKISNLSESDDVNSTRQVLEALGVSIDGERNGELSCKVHGVGKDGARLPYSSEPLVLDCGNSGTTMRLMSGVLASGLLGEKGREYILTGDASLSRRPMKRITEPLRLMGAEISDTDGHAPLHIVPRDLKGITWDLPIASAQVKSCLILAGLGATGSTELTEPWTSRDHTERMLGQLGVPVTYSDGRVRLEYPTAIPRFDCWIPSDVSAGAFLAAMALIVPGSEVILDDVTLNPSRMGFFRLLQRMCADVSWEEMGNDLGEPFGSIRAAYSSMQGITVNPEDVPASIDELTLIAILGAYAHGVTQITGADELRHKECDRIHTVCTELNKMNISTQELEDGLRVWGGTPKGAVLSGYGDHRIEMGMCVAAAAAEGQSVIEKTGKCAVSFPDFWNVVRSTGIFKISR